MGALPHDSAADATLPMVRLHALEAPGENEGIPLRSQPLQTLTSYNPASDTTTIVRRWTPGQAAACHRCATCTAIPGEDRQLLCLFGVRGRVTLDEARDHSPG